MEKDKNKLYIYKGSKKYIDSSIAKISFICNSIVEQIYKNAKEESLTSELILPSKTEEGKDSSVLEKTMQTLLKITNIISKINKMETQNKEHNNKKIEPEDIQIVFDFLREKEGKER